MRKILFITFLTFMFIIASALATFVYTNVVPVDEAALTSRFVNHSFTITITDINPMVDGGYNFTILRNDTPILGPLNYTNNTFYNRTILTVNGVYNWSINVTNGSDYLLSTVLDYTVAEPTMDTYKYELLAPNTVQTLISTDVNFSFIINVTGGYLSDTEQINCNIYNRSSRTGDYSILFSNNITNGTWFNRTYTLTDDNRHWWFVNCSTTFNPTYEISNVRIFDIDAGIGPEGVWNMEFGADPVINFTLGGLYAGNAVFKGDIIANSFNGTLASFSTDYAAEYSATGFKIENLTDDNIPNDLTIDTSKNITTTGGNFSVGSPTDPTNQTWYDKDGVLWRCGVDTAGVISCS